MFSSILDVLRLKFERVYNVAWISSSNSSSILSIITELIVPKVTAGSPKWQKKDQTVTRGCPEPPCFGNGIVDDVARGPHYLGVGEKDQQVTKGCPEASCFGTGIADDEGVGGSATGLDPIELF